MLCANVVLAEPFLQETLTPSFLSSRTIPKVCVLLIALACVVLLNQLSWTRRLVVVKPTIVRPTNIVQWFKWKDDSCQKKQCYQGVAKELQKIYKDVIRPVEEASKFCEFYSSPSSEVYAPELADADFTCRPLILVLGQYSVGKSTLLRHFLGRDYPGIRISPEPTTDKFVCVTSGESDQVIPGNVLVVDQNWPFDKLRHFGNDFLDRLEAVHMNCQVLEDINFIDTPGVLSGEKQRIKRGYDFEGVMRWFAGRADMILLLFDAHKLDISDEFKRCITALKGYDHKIHLMLNKADSVTTQELIRVHGALMWSLGKVIDTPEVSRVYVGSFWDEPLRNDELRNLFENEESDLIAYISQLPRNVWWRRVNDLIKRARLAKAHALLLNYLREAMPRWYGKATEQQKLIENLEMVFKIVADEHKIPLGDFPPVQLLQERLQNHDFSTFPPIDMKKIQAIDTMLSGALPALLKLIPQEQKEAQGRKPATTPLQTEVRSPFMAPMSSEFTPSQSEWIRKPDKSEYAADFNALGPVDGKMSGDKAKQDMMESKLPAKVLHRIWSLADADNDGELDLYEYALARHFIKMKLTGLELPRFLPDKMRP